MQQGDDVAGGQEATGSTEGRPGVVSARPSAVELLDRPGALLNRSDLAELGLTRTQVDAVFREICRTGGVVNFPGTRRPAVRVADYLALLERSTHREPR